MRFKKLGVVTAALPLAAVVSVPLIIGHSQSVQAAEMKLRGGFFIASKRTLYSRVWQRFVDKINAEGKGLVQIGKVVGPETVPRRQWCSVVRTGIVQIASFPSNWCSSLVRGVDGVQGATVPYAEQRKSGAYALIRKIHIERAGVYFLGQYGWGGQHHFFVNKRISTLEDFKGLRIRRSPASRNLITLLGADGVSIGLGQLYTAMERGVINGFALPLNFVAPVGLHKVVKYRIDPGVFRPSIGVFLNHATWKRMSPAQRAFMEKMGLYLENELDRDFARINKAMGDKLAKLGVERIVLSEKEAGRLRALAQKAIWGGAMKQNPEFANKLRPLVVK